MTTTRKTPAPAADPLAAARLFRPVATSILRLTGDILVAYTRSGWLLVELAYVLALYLFAFGYPFEPPFFFETAHWGLGLLTVCATTLLGSRAMRLSVAQPAIAHASRRAYVAALMLVVAVLRIALYVALLALVFLGGRFINATGGALFSGSLGLIAGCIVLAALTLALSPAFAPRPARLLGLAWLVAALYSYSAAGWLAALLFPFHLPLWPIFAGYAMGMTGSVGIGGLLALACDAAAVVGLALLADSWRRRLDTAPSPGASPTPERAGALPDPPASSPSFGTPPSSPTTPAMPTTRRRPSPARGRPRR